MLLNKIMTLTVPLLFLLLTLTHITRGSHPPCLPRCFPDDQKTMTDCLTFHKLSPCLSSRLEYITVKNLSTETARSEHNSADLDKTAPRSSLIRVCIIGHSFSSFLDSLLHCKTRLLDFHFFIFYVPYHRDHN